jgi:hypothetical protein
MSVAKKAAEAAVTAKAVKSSLPNPKIKPSRGITAALVGSLIVIGISEVKSDGGNVLDPRPFVATFGVFIILGFVAEVNPALGRMLAVLAFVAILLARGDDALSGLLGKSGKSGSRKKKPGKTPGRSSGSVSGGKKPGVTTTTTA